MEYVLVTTMVVALTEAIKAAADSNWRTVVIICGAAVVGGLCGFFEVEGLDLAEGVVVGLGASGAITISSRVGGMKK